MKIGKDEYLVTLMPGYIKFRKKFARQEVEYLYPLDSVLTRAAERFAAQQHEYT
jgi:hypothetical protein